MPTSGDLSRLAQEAKFVFKGTVQKLKSATMSDIRADERTVVVTVDEVVRAPAAFAKYAGKDITVYVGGRKKVAPGEQAVFYANGWRFGDGLAVKSIDHVPVAEAGSIMHAIAASGLGPASVVVGAHPTERLENAELQQHVESSDVIVTGRVINVRLAPETEASAPPLMAVRGLVGTAVGTRPQGQRISEHDPLWHEAVVEVADVEKGSRSTKRIVVRFPSSNDVRWYKAPKFKPGQEGVFMLRKVESARPSAVAGVAIRAPAKAERTEVYSATNAMDFRPLDQIETIRTLIKATATPRVTQGQAVMAATGGRERTAARARK